MAEGFYPRPAGSLRLLVADDEPHIRRILITLLEAAGFQVAVACDGPEALAYLRGAEECDLVLMDLIMPGLDGLEVLRRIREMEGRSGIPVIILSAKGQDTDRDEALALGANDFMTKPFSPKKLLNRLDEILAQG